MRLFVGYERCDFPNQLVGKVRIAVVVVVVMGGGTVEAGAEDPSSKTNPSFSFLRRYPSKYFLAEAKCIEG